MKVPTDYKILNEIYDRYYGAFAAFSVESPDRATKLFVPIDIQAIAGHMGVDGDIVFGRLYYHLDKKYGYKNDDGSWVRFFTPRAGTGQNCVNFPLLGAVLAGLREERRKDIWAIGVAVTSLLISIVSIVIAIVGP
ncbi:MAG: hypothetical protein JXA57_20515 [Armatimonadetes bacterium]|nr:hypothetical protein [Armatimonadota bacterium]